MNVTFDDDIVDSSIIQYSVRPTWDTAVNPAQVPSPLNNTNHVSTHPGAAVTFYFTGTSSEVFGYYL